MTAAGARAVLEVRDLHKTFHIGFLRKRVDAVRGVTFDVRGGETFGLLGPNGAGKTTTIKAVLRLIFPTRGSVSLFGAPSGDRASMRRVGYLPESPYVYQYLRAHEFLDLCGRLTGLGSKERAARSRELIERVGLAHAADRPIGKFSKGMMQRIGLAQALLHDPELLVLDEPMSGLDPIGRKEVRELVLEERARGKTIVFTSHILSDVEMLCDRIAIIQDGKLTALGTLDDLLRPEVRRVEIELEGVPPGARPAIAELAARVVEVEQRLVVTVEGDRNVPEILRLAMESGAHVVALTPHRETLEDLFVRNAVSTGD